MQLAASASGATGYRSNVDFMNPGGTTAHVSVKVRRGDGSQLSSGTFAVEPNGLLQRAIDDASAFPGVAGATDTNLWLEFTSDEPVVAFASVINNASGDPFAVVMNAEPGTPLVRAGCELHRLGQPGAGPARDVHGHLVQLSHDAALGVRRRLDGDLGGDDAAHVCRRGGVPHRSLRDERRRSVGGHEGRRRVRREPVRVLGQCGTDPWREFTPENVTCKTGVPCQITWTTTATNTTHGVAGLAAFGVLTCNDGQALDNVTPGPRNHPCTVTFSPATSGVWPYSCPFMGMMNGTITVIP